MNFLDFVQHVLAIDPVTGGCSRTSTVYSIKHRAGATLKYNLIQFTDGMVYVNTATSTLNVRRSWARISGRDLWKFITNPGLYFEGVNGEVLEREFFTPVERPEEVLPVPSSDVPYTGEELLAAGIPGERMTMPTTGRMTNQAVYYRSSLPVEGWELPAVDPVPNPDYRVATSTNRGIVGIHLNNEELRIFHDRERRRLEEQESLRRYNENLMPPPYPELTASGFRDMLEDPPRRRRE